MTAVSIVIISKHERGLAETLDAVGRQAAALGDAEVLVVDASESALDDIAAAHPGVRWIPFAPRPGKRITIPEQRNAGVRAAAGDVIVFTDCGCVPDDGWLAAITGPIRSGAEEVVAGRVVSRVRASVYDAHRAEATYLEECPTNNLAFTRRAFDAVGGFDEAFDYASDVDISWRWRDAGRRIRSAPDALVRSDWGTARRQLHRSFLWGAGRARLYLKHRGRLPQLARRDPIALVYPAFLAGLPVLALAPLTPWVLLYPLALLYPLWRNRRARPFSVVGDHLVYGTGVIWQLARQAVR